MELEAKYESELEDIQNRLVVEQDNLLNVFKLRQVFHLPFTFHLFSQQFILNIKKKQLNLKDFDHQQKQMIQQVKEETEYLEQERQKLIEQFKKEKNQLQTIEKKLTKLEQSSPMTMSLTSSQQHHLLNSPNSIMHQSYNENIQTKQIKQHEGSKHLKTVINGNENDGDDDDDDDEDDDYDQVPCNDDLLTTNSDTSINLVLNNNHNQTNKSIMSQSVHFGSLTSNNMNNSSSTTIKDSYQFHNNNTNKIYFNHKQTNGDHYQQSPKQSNSLVNKSNGSLNLYSNNNSSMLEKSIISPNSSQYAFKFAELEQKLALTRAENQVLLEEQVKNNFLFFAYSVEFSS